ncbi:MAG: TlpA family protein disulfide reductase [Acidobacteria bacterium]|nr:TlpA family protein disulfide reductase [Acidobacteriota bacterium]
MLRLAMMALATGFSLGTGDLVSPTGQPVSLDDLLARGPAVVVFWNSWLPQSADFLRLLPEIEAAAQRAAMPGLIVLFQDGAGAAIGSLSESRLRIAIDRRGTLLRRLQVTRAPAVLIVERDGRVRAMAGPRAAEVRQVLAALGQK